MKYFLESMYREDISSGLVEIEFRGAKLQWDNLDEKLLALPDGTRYKKDFAFEVTGKAVTGWVGILAKGSRANAGFSILQNGRMIRGWPDAYRPGKIYGQLQGSNDLVNQRLVGEINLDGFLVSHTKDDILWRGSEEEDLEEELLKACNDYRIIAIRRRSTRDDERGPSEADTELALDELKRESESPEMIDQISLLPIPPSEIVAASKKKITDDAQRLTATFQTKIDRIRDQNLSSRRYVTKRPLFCCRVRKSKFGVGCHKSSAPALVTADGLAGHSQLSAALHLRWSV